MSLTDDKKLEIKFITQRYDQLEEVIKEHEDISHKMRAEQRRLVTELLEMWHERN